SCATSWKRKGRIRASSRRCGALATSWWWIDAGPPPSWGRRARGLARLQAGRAAARDQKPHIHPGAALGPVGAEGDAAEPDGRVADGDAVQRPLLHLHVEAVGLEQLNE